jgi:O-antigen ligase
MGNAILLLVAVRSLRRVLICMPILVVSLLLTQSRGAILATGGGLLVLLLAQGARSPRVLAARVVPLALFLAAAFYFSPAAVQQRNTTFKAGIDTSAAYAIHIRDLFHAQARRVIHENPWVGVGVGQYKAGTVVGGDINTDPHQVLLFQRAEGGPFLEGGFILLVLGSLAAVAIRARKTELGPAALGVSVAVTTHGLVDVYWVRATPVLGWLLVGAALALAQERRVREP